MNDELLEAVKELCEYLELEDGEWPHIHGFDYSVGRATWVGVNDELATILYRLHMLTRDSSDE